MGFSPEYRRSVEEHLAKVADIRTKPMFGGVGIYANDLFFALIAEDKLYFKVDDSNRADFEAQGMGPFFPYDSPKPMHYWELPPGVLENEVELKTWVNKAVDVASTKKRR